MEAIHFVQPFTRAKRGLMPALAKQYRTAAAAATCGGWRRLLEWMSTKTYSEPRILFRACDVPELG